MDDLLFVLWFFLPAGVANVVPILVAKLPILRRWNYPFDCFKTFRGKRILGDHKTWRGVLLGTLLGAVAGLIIYPIFHFSGPCIAEYGQDSICIGVYQHLLEYGTADISFLWSFIFGGILGFLALMGDGLKSFVKRQMEIPAGKSFFLWDQIDYILLPSVIIAIFSGSLESWIMAVYAIFVWGILSLVSSYIGYLTKFKSEPI